MVRKNTLFGLILMMAIINADAQSANFAEKSLTRASATISQGLFFRNKVQPLYLHLNADYHIEKRVSFRSDANMLVAFQDDPRIFKHHHQLFFGIAYHFPNNKFDPYLNLQPGLSVTKLNKTLLGEVISPADEGFAVNPLISAGGGFNYYIGNFLHIALNSRFITGAHKMSTKTLSLNEFQFSLGLGWNLKFSRRRG